MRKSLRPADRRSADSAKGDAPGAAGTELTHSFPGASNIPVPSKAGMKLFETVSPS